MRRIVLRSTPSTREISRCDFPAFSKVWTEIRKLGFKTFTPGPFFSQKGLSVTSRRRSSSAPTGVDLRHQGGGVRPGHGWGILGHRRGAKGSLWLDAMTLLARRPNFNLAHAAVCSAIDSALLR